MLQAGFMILTIALALIVYFGTANIALKAITNPSLQKRFIIRTALLLAAWLTYISTLSVTGIFTVAALPPRIPLLLVWPAFIFTGFFFISGRFKKIIDATPVIWLVYLQSFRIIVELLIWGLFLNGILPKASTFEGYNFDILIGLTAPLVAYMAFNKRFIGNAVLLIWNFLGLGALAVVVFILLSHAYFPSMWHQHANILANGLGIFPYTFIAGFLMPLAVFLHVFTIIKIARATRQYPID